MTVRARAPASVGDALVAVTCRPAIEMVVRFVAGPDRWERGLHCVETVSRLAVLTDLPPRSVVVLDRENADVPIGDDMAAVRVAIPEARVAVLSDDTSGVAVLEALRNGARGYLRSPEDLMSLGDIVSRVARGDTVVPLDLQVAAVEELGYLARRVRAGVDAAAALTPRERQVLPLLADGLTSRQIANRLAISPRTVERHVSDLYRKLGVRTRLQAVARAASIGLVDVH